MGTFRRSRTTPSEDGGRKRPSGRGRISMSGPKAFRIVTRAEIVAICRRNLARLDAAVESWTSVCRANETIRQSDIDEVVGRRNAIRQLLDADRFTDLQKQVAVEISY